MRYLDCMIAWTPSDFVRHGCEHTLGKVKVGPWPDRTGWSDEYAMTVGACFKDRHDLPIWQLVAIMFTDFQQIVTAEGMDAMQTHREFCKIDEFRAVISPDIEGADPDLTIEELSRYCPKR